MPAYGALNSSFTVNAVVHDPLTGLDTGSGNDRITTGLGEDNFTTGAGGDSFNCDDILLGHGAIGYEMQAGIGISANARGKTTGTIAALQIDTGSGNDHLTGNDMWSPAPECTYTSEPDGNDPIVHHVGGSAGPGGTSYLTGYAEAVGLDSSTVDVMNNFTNFAMPVGDFI